MLKSILKLEGAQKLTNSEQKSINGGACVILCCPDTGCSCVPKGTACMLQLIDFYQLIILTNSKNHIMLKNILKLEGAQKIEKNEQKKISAGSAPYCEAGFCARRSLEDGKWVWDCLPC